MKSNKYKKHPWFKQQNIRPSKDRVSTEAFWSPCNATALNLWVHGQTAYFIHQKAKMRAFRRKGTGCGDAASTLETADGLNMSYKLMDSNTEPWWTSEKSTKSGLQASCGLLSATVCSELAFQWFRVVKCWIHRKNNDTELEEEQWQGCFH